jgi:hypothetical protein
MPRATRSSRRIGSKQRSLIKPIQLRREASLAPGFPRREGLAAPLPRARCRFFRRRLEHILRRANPQHRDARAVRKGIKRLALPVVRDEPLHARGSQPLVACPLESSRLMTRSAISATAATNRNIVDIMAATAATTTGPYRALWVWLLWLCHFS